MNKHIVGEGELLRITESLFRIEQQIRMDGGSPIDPKLVEIALQEIIGGRFRDTDTEISRADNHILHLIPGYEAVVIEECDGAEFLSDATQVFGEIDFGIKKLLRYWNGHTKAQVVSSYALVKDSFFQEIFTSFGSNLNSLCLTEAQIVSFCRSHRKWLCKPRCVTHFLLKNGDQFVVIRVRAGRHELPISTRSFSRRTLLRACPFCRFVVPQLPQKSQ